jgi:hypothetical protein
MRRGIGVAEGLARPVRDQVEVEVPDDDSPNHLRRHGRTRRAETHVPIGRCEEGAPGGLNLGLTIPNLPAVPLP